MAATNLSQLQAGNLFNVNGLVAVVTGGGSGLGQYMARTLACNGAHKVYIIGRREDALKETANSVSTKNIIPLPGDVTSKDSLRKCVDAVKQEVDHVDVVICNSGITGPAVKHKDQKTQEPVSLEELAESMFNVDPESVTSTFHVNFTGVHLTIAAFLPLLDQANKKRPQPPTADNFTPRPQIITTSSVGGFSRRALENFSYGPSKAAVVHLTRQLATSLIPYDIRCNTIAPGLYLSEMTKGSFDRLGFTDKHNVEGTWPKDQVPATRTGDEQDIAGAILFLCSRAGAYINANILLTDGGRLTVIPGSY